jgi:ABC-type sugar transport system ATPase subunit
MRRDRAIAPALALGRARFLVHGAGTHMLGSRFAATGRADASNEHPRAMATVSLRQLSKAFGAHTVVDAVDLDIADREFLVLVGPSGCGKSTILRMIAGLEEVTDGEICIGGERVNDREPKDRDIAMVFQDYALYPHMTVADNMAFSLLYRGVARAEIKHRVNEAARVLDLGRLLERYPRQLSGGQRQRVAMGRAIVRDPKVFLFDEPLSNLDAKLRVQMRTEIKRLRERLKTTTVYVTHDQVEAMTLADRIAVLDGGRIQQVGSPEDVYERPATSFVAGFIGAPPMNLIASTVVHKPSGAALELPAGVLLPLPAGTRLRVDEPVIAGIRPEHFEWVVVGRAAAIEAPATVVEPLGSDTLVGISLGDQHLQVRLPPRRVRRAHEMVRLNVAPECLHLFDRDGRRISS